MGYSYSFKNDKYPSKMTDDEQKLLNSFRAINDRQQKNMLRAMESAEVKFPREPTAAPRLSLVRPFVSNSLLKRVNKI